MLAAPIVFTLYKKMFTNDEINQNNFASHYPRHSQAPKDWRLLRCVRCAYQLLWDEVHLNTRGISCILLCLYGIRVTIHHIVGGCRCLELCYRVTVLQSYSVTVLQCYSVTELQIYKNIFLARVSESAGSFLFSFH